MGEAKILGRLLNVEEAAEFLHVKVSSIRQKVFKKKIPHIKVGSLVRFKEEQLLGYLEANTIGVRGDDKKDKELGFLGGN